MVFIRPATQTLLRRAASSATAAVRTRNVVPTSSLLSGNNLTWSPTRRGFADAAVDDHSQRSPWADFHMAPPDAIIGLTEAYLKDDFPDKVNVGVGAYRCDLGKPFVLPVVREAEKDINMEEMDHEYSGIAGCPDFVNLALKFAYGEDCVPLREKRIAGVQTLSGTGGLRVFGEMLHQFGHKHIYVPNPTWGNHIPIFTNAGLEVRKYAYYDNEKRSLDFSNLIDDIRAMPEGSCVLLHACAHNPTGMDPTLDQWKEISNVVMEKNLLPFFDCAYQGFASGDARKDAAAIRMFVEDGHKIALVQSFSKNFGLYGQRIGALSVVADDQEEAQRVLSQLKVHIRPSYSNPPRHGARIVSKILSSEKKTDEFVEQCMGMANRINAMRIKLRQTLEDVGSTKTWDHITNQIGMFAYSGMSKDEVVALREKHHIYCTLDGRISMAGVTSKNVEYIARSIHDVTKEK
mmetsp:Transcript_25251/g.45426  ORF Transcript_25251/g.45426 Transcript_25251/m.45426 type:complete len:461 (+) Transcript_25251:99-1481(+)|eukprot:CAMPEP_0201889830 /NCGR_PEP_ID=MMETSP0902-20130614/30938_1 /ASSEMBLY_ACC=CAM_ASM_000551 /TAXON_ID=420261 /ORGANISM="Thalassiosira antarctica, Strain CCMP982" /LENGTH=460 /DNA_ID=CAMNT_0048420515 /DNA_START=10 /DNA_END=1392 /DNA_ORIENTATION=-